MGAARFFVRLCAVAAVAVAALVGAGVAGAAGSATLTIQVFPSTLLPGGAGAVLATFTNTGQSTLTHVVVTVDLGGATFDAAGSSAACTAAGPGATCSLGNVASGGTAAVTAAFTNAPSTGPVTFDGTATWNSPTVGKPNGVPPARDTASGTASANLLDLSGLADAASNCDPGGGTLSAQTEGGQQIDVNAGDNTLGLTCTPILAGIDNGGILFTKLPPLATPATVTLTFPDETLPGSVDNPSPLTEYPNYPDTSTSVVVPPCDPGPAIPAGHDSCIVSVNPSDDDEDADAGTIDLLVQGSATGDPGYH